MIQFLRNRFSEFYASFHDSEVILWARLQYVLLAIYTALQSVDVSEFISDHRMLQCYIFANALLTEFLRRRRAEF